MIWNWLFYYECMVDYKDMFLGVIALSLLSLGIYKGLDLLQLICCPWLRKK